MTLPNRDMLTELAFSADRLAKEADQLNTILMLMVTPEVTNTHQQLLELREKWLRVRVADVYNAIENYYHSTQE